LGDALSFCESSFVPVVVSHFKVSSSGETSRLSLGEWEYYCRHCSNPKAKQNKKKKTSNADARLADGGKG
jgi:hypothetical protein